MRRTYTITDFHPKAPKKLIRLYKQHGGNCYKLGRVLEVNPAHIWNLLKHGHEPKRSDLREKLFLKVSRQRKQIEVPEHVKLWRRLPKAERDKVIQQYIQWRNKNNVRNDANRVPDST